MPGPWFTQADCYAAVQDALSTLSPPAKWTGISQRAAEKAHADLCNILGPKGFTDAQLDAWDDRVTYSRDLALFWAHVEGGLFSPAQADVAGKLDRRDELRKTGSIRVNGKFVTPGATDPAVGVGAGDLTQLSGGVNYGTTFGLARNRRNGLNQYGDPIRTQDPPPPGQKY